MMADLTLVLTDLDQKILGQALDNYRINRSAQKMLDGQKERDKVRQQTIYTRYDGLIARIKLLQASLPKPS